MAQRFAWGSASASGIIGVLILAGVFLYFVGLATNNIGFQFIGGIAAVGGVVIGILYAILGIIGIIQRYGGF